MAGTASENLVIPKGRVWVAEHSTTSPTTPAKAFRPVGNCPEFTLSMASEKLEHESSMGGLKEVDASVTLSTSRSGTFSTDDMGEGNFAMLFFAAKETITQASASSGVIETITAPIKGFGYQLGAVPVTRPFGHRKVTVTSVTSSPAGTTYTAGVDYEYDSNTGWFEVTKGSAINGDIIVTYNVATSSYVAQKSGNSEKAYTFLIRANNPVGENIDYYMPLVKARPNGEFSLISEEWQKMSFEIDVLKLSGYESVHFLRRPE